MSLLNKVLLGVAIYHVTGREGDLLFLPFLLITVSPPPQKKDDNIKSHYYVLRSSVLYFFFQIAFFLTNIKFEPHCHLLECKVGRDSLSRPTKDFYYIPSRVTKGVLTKTGVLEKSK